MSGVSSPLKFARARPTRLLAALAVSFACMLVAASCREGDAGRAPEASGSDAARAEGSPPSPPKRIISLSPSATEILYGVGAFERVVAVSDYCEYPPQVESLPRIGGWNNPQLERIAALRPDLLIFADAQAPFIKEKAEALGMKTLSVPDKTIEDALAAIEIIGRAAGREEEGRRLMEETRAKIEEVRARTSGLPRRRALCVVDRVPGTLREIYSAAPGSFISQLVEVAGGESIAPSAATGWGKIQKEAIVALDPEIIIDLMMQESEGTLSEDTQKVWRELPQVRAVREGRVYALRDTKLIHPSQFVGDAAQRFAELIHPEAFQKR